MALAWSGTFDDLIGGVISKYFEENAAMGLPGLAPYPDVFAAFLILLLSGKNYETGVVMVATVIHTHKKEPSPCFP